MTTDDALYRFRLRALALAQETGNVRAACRAMGIHPSTFYRWRHQALRFGPEMLRPRERRRPRMANQTSPFVEQRVVAFALGQPGFGPSRISAELRREKWGGIVLSPNGVHRVLRRHGLNTRAKRLPWDREGPGGAAPIRRSSAAPLTEDVDPIAPGLSSRSRSPDFLDVERFPEIRFRSTKVELPGGNDIVLTGDLTIRDVTRPVVLQVEFAGLSEDTRGNRGAGFSATSEINREEFGASWNLALEAGGWLVSKTVQIELDVLATLKRDQDS